LLAQLIRERLVVQHSGGNRCYALGPLAFELGLAAAQQFDIRSRSRATLERLAIDAGDTVYLVMRSGWEAVCLDMVEGPSPIRVVTLRAGSRRPLGLGAGGLAILAALPDPEREDVLAEVMPHIESDWNFPAPALRRSIDDARRLGYALIRNRVTPGVTAIGMPFRDSMGRTAGAVSIAAVNSRMSGSRVAMLASLLRQAVGEVEAGFRSGHAFEIP
jgi:DNA-binding IclR family transcriptional regulator